MEQSDQRAFTEYDQQGDKIINPGTLTKQQQKYFEQARQQHRKNMTKEQRVGTKVFKGNAFIAKPDTILFKDFEVGKTHILVLTLTNISNAFNSFNVLPLPQKIRNYFQVEYIPKGKISPGISCDIRFKFIPQLNQDLTSEFSILAETGKISYPILCTSKKTIVKCQNPVVDFGRIIYGQQKKATLLLRNAGTLPSAMVFQTQKGVQFSRCQNESQKNLIQQLSLQKLYNIQGNAQKLIEFVLKPQNIGIYELNLQLYIKNFINSPAINVSFIANCIEVPVKIQRPVYDFEICLLNHIYRQRLVFYNQSENPMSFKMSQPSETKKYFEFNPVLGYIQKQAKIDVWVKFSAEKDLPVHLNKYMIGPNMYSVPFYMSAKDQVLPVYFDLKFKITSQRVNIKPCELNFGSIFEGLSSKLEVTFENQSELPQEILLYPMRKQISVQNDQPLLKILPKQTAKTYIIYQSKKLEDNGKPIKEEGSIPCKIITGDIATNQIKLEYSCETIRPDLFIFNNKIDLPALQIQEICSVSTIIKNNASKEIIFEIFVPHFEVCGLRVTPVVKVLPANQQVQINIEYNSAIRKLGPLTLKKLNQSYKKDQVQEEQLKEQSLIEPPKKEGKKDAKKETKLTKQQQEQLEAEEKTRQQNNRLKEEKEAQELQQLERNFDMEKELTKIGGKLYEFGNMQHYKWLLPLYFKQKDYPDASAEVNFIEIATTATQKTLLIDIGQIDFGQIAVGAREVRQVVITNNGQKAQLIKKQLPVFCCFNVLNSMKQIESEGKFKAVVQFQPIEEQKFEQKLTFYTNKYTVSCQLKGKGVRPEVTIDPESGLLNLGSVLLDQYTEKSFKIKNICNFQVQFNLKRIGEGICNSNSSRAITYIPTNGAIDPNNSVQIKVRFKPDRIGDKFFQKIRIHVPEQKEQKYVFVEGACYSRQAYVVDHKDRRMPENRQVMKKIEHPFDSLKIKDQDIIYGANNKRIVLEFKRMSEQDKDNEACTKRKLIVGSCKLLDNKMEKPTNFEIVMPVILQLQQKDDRFSCDNLKGVVAPGTEIIITFTYKSQESDPFISKIPILAGIGQWKEIKCELKFSGGFSKPGAIDAINFDLILCAYINQL